MPETSKGDVWGCVGLVLAAVITGLVTLWVSNRWPFGLGAGASEDTPEQVPAKVPSVPGQQEAPQTVPLNDRLAEAAAVAFSQAGLPIPVATDGKIEYTDKSKVGLGASLLRDQDFAVEVRFYNPHARSEAPWSYGFIFRSNRDGSYRLSVGSDGEWDLRSCCTKRNPNGTVQMRQITGGKVESLDVSSTGSNRLRLIARGSLGLFFVNERLAGVLDLSERNITGPVFLGANFMEEHGIAGKGARYGELKVWSLSRSPVDPVAALAWDSLAQTAQNLNHFKDGQLLGKSNRLLELLWLRAGVRNFVAEVWVENPTSASKTPWDYGFLFRSTGRNDQYRLSVDSRGEWSFRLTRTSSEGGVDEEPLGRGRVVGLDLSPGAKNHLRLAVKDGTALFLVNGITVGPLDVSARNVAGDVSFATEFNGSEEPGRRTRYEKLSIATLN